MSKRHPHSNGTTPHHHTGARTFRELFPIPFPLTITIKNRVIPFPLPLDGDPGLFAELIGVINGNHIPYNIPAEQSQSNPIVMMVNEASHHRTLTRNILASELLNYPVGGNVVLIDTHTVRDHTAHPDDVCHTRMRGELTYYRGCTIPLPHWIDDTNFPIGLAASTAPELAAFLARAFLMPDNIAIMEIDCHPDLCVIICVGQQGNHEVPYNPRVSRLVGKQIRGPGILCELNKAQSAEQVWIEHVR